MLFSEKLDFLLKLTGTSNKQLATALSIDPSLVSRMRQGRRKPPQKGSHIKEMAEYFSQKCTTSYHKSAIAEIIGKNKIRLVMKGNEIALVLYEWLSSSAEGKIQPVEQVIHSINSEETERILGNH